MMRTRALFALPAVLLGAALLLPRPAAAEEIPLVSELTAPEEKTQAAGEGEEGRDGPVYPRTLSAREGNLEPVDLLPADAYCYIEAPSGAGLATAFGRTAIMQLLAEDSVQRFIRENNLSLDLLLDDLPQDYSSESMRVLGTVGLNLVRTFADAEGRVALAAYPAPEGGTALVFLANIGWERREPYETLQTRLEAARVQYPELAVERGDHADDYLDVLRTPESRAGHRLVTGFLKNLLVVATDEAFAEELRRRAEGGAETVLGDTPAYGSLAAKTLPDSQVRGFLNLGAIIQAVAESRLEKAEEIAVLAGDLAHRDIIYYDLLTDETAVRERFTIPVTAAGGSATLATRVRMVCRRDVELNSESLQTPRLLPYQPVSFTALMVRPADFVSLLQEERLFGTSRMSAELSAMVPDVLREVTGRLAGGEAESVLTGEVGIALLPAVGRPGGYDWVIVMPVAEAERARQVLGGGRETATVSGVEVHLPGGGTRLEAGKPAWAVFARTETLFRNLERPYLVITSSGLAMRATIDRTIGGGAILAHNRDFARTLDAVGGRHAVIAYENLPQAVQTRYPNNLRQTLRQAFPAVRAPHAIPPLRDISEHLFGMSSALSITDEDEVRASYYSPTGQMPALAGALVLAFPQWLRAREENAILEARTHLQNLGLALQEYATQYGHFPQTLSQEPERTILNDLLPQAMPLETVTTNPGAVLRLGDREEARKESYVYIPNLLPSDLPERVILYTAQPWHYRYRTRQRDVYERAYLVLRMDGSITAYSPADFERHVLPKIEARR